MHKQPISIWILLGAALAYAFLLLPGNRLTAADLFQEPSAADGLVVAAADPTACASAGRQKSLGTHSYRRLHSYRS